MVVNVGLLLNIASLNCSLTVLKQLSVYTVYDDVQLCFLGSPKSKVELLREILKVIMATNFNNPTLNTFALNKAKDV